MNFLFKELKLQEVVEGTKGQPNMLDPNYPAWEEKDLAAKLEIMSNLEDPQLMQSETIALKTPCGLT